MDVLGFDIFAFGVNFLGASSMSGNQEPTNDPTTGWGVVWRYIKEKPALDVVSIILLLFVAYFIARMFAVDPLEPPVEFAAKKFSLPAGPPDISGNWEYLCVRRGGRQAWGGDAWIQLKKEQFGQVIRLTGERKWETSDENINNRHNISPPTAWETDGGVFVTDETVQWHYFTHAGDTSDGFAQVHLHKTNGEVDRMEGRFSEVSKQDPKYGSLEFSR